MAITWVTSFTGTLAADNVNTGGTTWRFGIPNADISNTGLSYVRVTCHSASAVAWTLGNMYIGQKADSGDYYDFQAAPTQVTFSSGSAGFAIGADSTIVSDTISFSIPAGKDLIISLYGSNTSNDGIRISVAGVHSGSTYYKAGSEAATQNATGYSLYGYYNFGIALIESGSDEAAGGTTTQYYRTQRGIESARPTRFFYCWNKLYYLGA